MKIQHRWRVEHLSVLGKGYTDQSRIIVDVLCDDVECGSVVVASGPTLDIQDLIDGQLTMQELSEKWAPKVRVRISPTSQEMAEDEESECATQRFLSTKSESQ